MPMNQPSAANLYSIVRDRAARQAQEPSRDALRDELQIGLQASQPFVSPKYLYDSLGSKLFEAICELPEYYPTRTEAAIFHEQRSAIAEAVGRGATLNADRSRCRQLREGRRPVFRAATWPVCADRYLGRFPE
jgi:hypothetical protein